MSEFRFSRQSIENNSDRLRRGFKRSSARSRTCKVGGGIRQYEPEEAHCDCQLKMIYALLKPQHERGRHRQTWGKAFDDMKDKNDSLSSNSRKRDLEEPTTDLQIEIGTIRQFYPTKIHVGPTHNFLRRCNQLSSKQGDIGTIGEFGLGLKYWWKWYKEFALDITCDCQGTPWTHRLSSREPSKGRKAWCHHDRTQGHQSAPVSRSANGKTRPNSLICPTACRISTAES